MVRGAPGGRPHFEAVHDRLTFSYTSIAAWLRDDNRVSARGGDAAGTLWLDEDANGLRLIVVPTPKGGGRRCLMPCSRHAVMACLVLLFVLVCWSSLSNSSMRLFGSARVILDTGLSGIVLTKQCPGEAHISGLGPMSLIAAFWDTPERRAGGVAKSTSGGLVATMRSRTYFGSSCASDSFDNAEYASLKLLGKTLSYAVNLASAGCGCNAALYLTSLPQNLDKGTCGDYYCDAHSVCGIACAEIDVQEANRYAYYATLHSAQEWNATVYGPGAACIDTLSPFMVSVSFPEDDEGNLAAMDVRLSQPGRPCPLALHLGRYIKDDVDNMPALSDALKAGMTPIVSYWGSGDNMTWMDGVGPERHGPCRADHPETCGASVNFYNFAIGPIAFADEWAIYRQHDIPDKADVETMSSDDIQAVQRRVKEMNYAGFAVHRDKAYLKSSEYQLTKESLTYMGNKSEVTFYAYGSFKPLTKPHTFKTSNKTAPAPLLRQHTTASPPVTRAPVPQPVPPPRPHPVPSAVPVQPPAPLPTPAPMPMPPPLPLLPPMVPAPVPAPAPLPVSTSVLPVAGPAFGALLPPTTRAKKPKTGIVLKILSAHDLRGADWIDQSSDPFCSVKVPNKPDGSFTTHTLDHTMNPVWNFNVTILSFDRGDNLHFIVWDRDWLSNNLLGSAMLTSDQIYPTGFRGDLLLTGGGNDESHPRLSVEVDVRELVQENV